MKSTTDSSNQQMLEEFLKDLLLYVDRPDQVDLLIEILREINQSPSHAAARAAS